MVDTDQIATSGDYMSEIGKFTSEIEMMLLDYGSIIDFWSDESLYFILYGLKEGQVSSFFRREGAYQKNNMYL